MPFSTFAGRRHADFGTSDHAVGKRQFSVRSTLSAIGQNWLQGSRCCNLDDRLLQDIGLKRADLDAYRL